jgi:hypothetical protein
LKSPAPRIIQEEVGDCYSSYDPSRKTRNSSPSKNMTHRGGFSRVRSSRLAASSCRFLIVILFLDIYIIRHVFQVSEKHASWRCFAPTSQSEIWVCVDQMYLTETDCKQDGSRPIHQCNVLRHARQQQALPRARINSESRRPFRLNLSM